MIRKVWTCAVVTEGEEVVQTLVDGSWVHSCVVGSRKDEVMGAKSVSHIQTWPSVVR